MKRTCRQASPKRLQLRLADARVVVDRHLADGEAAAIRLEDHLGRELHSGRVQVEHRKSFPPHGTHATVRVGNLDSEEDVEHPGEHGVSDEAVEERHCIAVDRPLESRADDEVVATLQTIDEPRQLAHRIRVVRVAHDDVFAARRLETREVGTPVSTARLRYDDRAMCRRDLGRGVGRAVVDDDDLADTSRVLESLRKPGRRPGRPPPPRSGRG